MLEEWIRVTGRGVSLRRRYNSVYPKLRAIRKANIRDSARSYLRVQLVPNHLSA